VTPITKAKRLPKVDEAEGSRFVKWDEMGLQKNGNNAAYENVSNVSLVFQRHPAQAGHIWFDNFRGRVYHNLRGKEEQWTDADDTAACIWIQQQVGFNKISTGVVREGIAMPRVRILTIASRSGSNRWYGMARRGSMTGSMTA